MQQVVASFEDEEVIFLAGSSGEANELTSTLCDPATRIADSHFITSFVPGINGRCLARPGCRSRSAVFFMQQGLNAAAAEGRIDFRPLSYFGIHRHLSDAQTRIDTVVVQVAPPDGAGECSLGPAVEFMPSVVERAVRVIGIINPAVPDLRGSARLAMDRFHAITHSTAPLAVYDVGAPSSPAEALVGHLKALIPNGATLQVGLGKIPSQLLDALTRHRELALHTGMISDAALRLAASGAMRRSRPITAGVAVGGRDFYRRLTDCPGLRLGEVAFTHAPRTLSRLHRLHAVNSALQVDLLGQVNAETIDGRYVSGPGGLPDFARAAHLDPDGLSIIALLSTDAGGAVSRIVARLDCGAPVSVPQHDVDAVVTEHGVAWLRGEALDARARRLCAVAHPRHRPALEQSAKELLR